LGRELAGRPTAKPVRLFVAVPTPASVGPIVDAAAGPWRERFPGMRWVPPEHQHVTLKFLGNTDPRLLGWVQDQVREVAGADGSFELRLDGLGAFPSQRRARVLWVGLLDADARLAALASALDAGLASEFAPERRPYTAHLTVARSDPPLSLPDGLLATSLASDPFTVNRIVLMRSHLARPGPQGPERYEVLGSFQLDS
jgi:RNA 2',3'-cyclic 3'-phosphodiesterase